MLSFCIHNVDFWKNFCEIRTSQLLIANCNIGNRFQPSAFSQTEMKVIICLIEFGSIEVKTVDICCSIINIAEALKYQQHLSQTNNQTTWP